MMRSSKRKQLKLERKQPSRKPYDRVLIVTEGEKTEPNYFNDLIKDEGLSSANVVVTGDCGCDPTSVVNQAIKLFKESKKGGSSTIYNRVFCVFDRDGHANFDSAINKASSNNIEIICSYPCFEYWYLCHFEYTRKGFQKTGNQSSAENCIKELNIHWNNNFKKKYGKSDAQPYVKLKTKLNNAINNAKKAQNDADSTGEMNPSTRVYKLVDYLKSLKRSK
ncbi:RloB family protein [Pasteurella skyensis]|uniref:RloB family protein n=2 Tax=Pasteurellales TaxID=135625 RepID=A0AAJ6NCZ1_9PAST|nr:RloB family protein [Pasteurella skyensis]MDP8170538.1 RloB family protein [Pasteurella skyensis]MDP8174500.1 RloB family protein [Pasteurella skyensis]